MTCEPQNQKKETTLIKSTEVVSKPGAALEVKVVELTQEAKRAISDGLKWGKAAAYKSASR